MISGTIPYASQRFIFPPRPKLAVPVSALAGREGEGWIAQPKLDGDCLVVFTDGERVIVRTRKNEPHKKVLTAVGDLTALHRGRPGTWTVLVAEGMSKSKRDPNGTPWPGRLVIHDLLAIDGTHLMGTTFAERVSALDEMYGTESSDQPELLSVPVAGVYRVRSHWSGYTELFDRITGSAEMYEGVVLKRAAGRLGPGMHEDCTSAEMMKSRRPTVNYLY